MTTATYLGSGDASRHRRDYRPEWLDNLADDVTIEGSVLTGIAQGPEAIRAILGFARQLYDYQEFNYVGRYGDDGFVEDYTSVVRGEPIGSVVVIRFNEAGQAARIVVNHRPLRSVLLWSQLMGEHFAGTHYAQYFLSHDAAEALHEADGSTMTGTSYGTGNSALVGLHHAAAAGCGRRETRTSDLKGPIMTASTETAASPAHRGGSYSDLPNLRVGAANGLDYAYRDTSPGNTAGVPLVLLQRFRGNLDNWDPALIDALATSRRVLAFDNAGVGSSTGATPDTVEQMAYDAIAFIDALDLAQVDLMGFSIGSFVAQQIALTRPSLVRRLILASAAPQGAVGMHGWAPDVIGAVGNPQPKPEQYLDVFFTRSAASRQAGQENLERMSARTKDRDKATTWATRQAQYDAVCRWGIPNHGLLQQLSCLELPVFVANGDSDPMISPHYSYLLAGLIPQARVKIYPDSAHGFLCQHHAEFAADVDRFLSASV